MNPKEQDIFKSLNLLVMLSRSRRQLFSNLSDEEKATLSISRQVLSDSGLTIPKLTNSLQHIAEKGYLYHVIIFDEHLRSQMNEFLNSEHYDTVLETLKKQFDNKEMSDKLSQAVVEDFGKMMPASVQIDLKPEEDEEIKFSEAFVEGIGVFKNMRLDEIGFVLLMPFRDIETLFEKVSNGEKFDDIQDDGFWYDKNNFEFHIDGQTIKTSYQNKPNLVHSILNEFFSKPSVSKVEYEEMVEFDIAKGNEAYRDAMRKFTKNHPKLKQMFKVHLYDTEFFPDNY